MRSQRTDKKTKAHKKSVKDLTQEDYKNLVGGEFFKKVLPEYTIVIPSYLAVSQYMYFSLSNDRILLNPIAVEQLSKNIDLFYTWYEKYRKTIGRLVNSSPKDLLYDIKHQLRAIIELSKVFLSFKDTSFLLTQSLLSHTLNFAKSQGWIQFTTYNKQAIYYFSPSFQSQSMLSRDLAMECFSLMLASMINPIKLNNEIRHLLKDHHSADVPVNVHTKSPKNTKHKCAPDDPANLRVQLQENRYISVKPFTVFDPRPSQTVTPPSVVDVDLASSHQLFGLSMSI